MRLFVSGGRQRGAVNLGKMVEWSLYEEARLLELDTQSGEVSVRLGYTTPPELCAPDDPSHVFKAGSWGDGGKLWLVTQTEVLEVDPQANAAGAFRIARRISHPWFNDLHHAAFFDDCLQVVSTGLDALLVLGEGRRGAGRARRAGARAEFRARVRLTVGSRRRSLMLRIRTTSFVPRAGPG